MSEELTQKYPINSLLITRYVDSSLRFFRVTGHTQCKVRVHQIVPFINSKGYLKVRNDCIFDTRTNVQGLATVKEDDTLIWKGWVMKLWPRNTFDSSTDKPY